MKYQLNNNFDLGETTAINPTWSVMQQIDNPIDKTVGIVILFEVAGLCNLHARNVAVMPYMASWEDSDVVNYLMGLDAFKNSKPV